MAALQKTTKKNNEGAQVKMFDRPLVGVPSKCWQETSFYLLKRLAQNLTTHVLASSFSARAFLAAADRFSTPPGEQSQTVSTLFMPFYIP